MPNSIKSKGGYKNEKKVQWKYKKRNDTKIQQGYKSRKFMQISINKKFQIL